MESRELSLAQMCGNRCKSIRMVKGMTQQELAEKLNVTAAAVSKWEKDGVSHIDQIKAISDALGQDITADQFDQEGTVGAVGKEILSILVKHGGITDFTNALSHLYGMKADRVTNELAKLERIGTIVREQYIDYNSVERDALFITAKGVIVSKSAEFSEEELRNVKTFDQITAEGYSSIQDIIDNDKVTALLFKIGNEGKAFRCDYIFHLMRNYFNPGITNNSTNNSIYRNVPDTCELMSGHSAYVDILRRMVQSTNRDEMDQLIDEAASEWKTDYGKINDEYVQKATGLEKLEREAIKCFQGWLLPWNNPFYDYDEDEIAVKYKIDSGITAKEINEAEEDNSMLDLLEVREGRFFSELPEEKYLDISSWFSEDEIKDFIINNIRKPETGAEKEINQIINDIWEANEETQQYYYAFPDKWEKNGLAQLVRTRVGLDNGDKKH